MRRTDFSTLSSLYQILQNCQWFSKMLNQEVEQKRFSVMKSNRWRSVFLQQICLDRHWIPNQLDASWNHARALGSVDIPSRRPFWALSAFYPFLQNLRVTHSSELVLLAPTGTLIVMMVYYIYIDIRTTFWNFTQSIGAIDVTSVTLSYFNSINAFDVKRCKLMLIECQMFQWSNDPMFKCSNVPMFQCSNDPMF